MKGPRVVSSCCEGEIDEQGGHVICQECGRRCDAVTPFADTAEGQRESAAEWWADSERNGD